MNGYRNGAAQRIAPKLRATRPQGAVWLNDSSCAPAHNTPLPLERSPPASFKRLLGSDIASRNWYSMTGEERRPRCENSPDEFERPVNASIGHVNRDVFLSDAEFPLTVTAHAVP